jgi:hypothetical protein
MTPFTRADLDRALSRLAMLRYWPADPATRAEIGLMLARMVPHREALDWLVDAMINRVGEWRGPVELRGVLCWRYRPADGIEQDATSAGFTPLDGEAQSALSLPPGGAVPREIAEAAERKRLTP